MPNCTNAAGHQPDNQGYCHECGIPMAEANKEYSRQHLLNAIKVLSGNLESIPEDVRDMHGVPSRYILSIAKKIVAEG